MKLTLALAVAALISAPAFANEGAAAEGHEAAAAADAGAAHAGHAAHKGKKKMKKELKTTEEHTDSAHHE